MRNLKSRLNFPLVEASGKKAAGFNGERLRVVSNHLMTKELWTRACT